jgi:hypothetical protein
MAQFCKDHIVNPNAPIIDLTGWLEDMFNKYEFYKYSPKIVMGHKTVSLFVGSIVEGMDYNSISGTTLYLFKGFAVPKSWIIINGHVDPYYISIIWEVYQIPESIRLNCGRYDEDMKTLFEPSFKFSSVVPWDPSRLPDIKKVIYNNPATIILWSDHTKTVVQCQKGDDYDPEKGLAMAIAKKALGNTSRKLNDVLHKWEKKEE